MVGEEIADEEQLWRRVHPLKIKSDGTPESDVFRGDGVSVHRARLTTLEAVRAEFPELALFGFTAGQARGLSIEVVPDPPPPDHALIRATTSKKARRLRDLAQRVA